MAILIAVVLEEFGVGLTRTHFDEVMLAIFEHIPGLETLPAAKHSVRRNLHAPTDRTRNSRPFQPTIPIRSVSVDFQ